MISLPVASSSGPPTVIRVVGAARRDPAEHALAARHVRLVAAQEVERALGADLLLAGLLVDGLPLDLIRAPRDVDAEIALGLVGQRDPHHDRAQPRTTGNSTNSASSA
jgi:hypothetical protein